MELSSARGSTVCVRATLNPTPCLPQAKQDERLALAERNRAPRPPQGAAYDQGVIIAVLAHRADRSASKFLKKELNLPKTEASPKSLAGLTSGFTRLTSKMRNAL